ncbi:unnamed protein product [Effrenium voratum]|uniref:Secreted protein n=1 Tax=Effrenium voratum TaxID=2562239 RepID=A0AA36HQ70_9DINO|nr:unnamed protein product [Effrenium voratum]CAJ1445395.1 unnamed protein product [Effrenium voratum]
MRLEIARAGALAVLRAFAFAWPCSTASCSASALAWASSYLDVPALALSGLAQVEVQFNAQFCFTICFTGWLRRRLPCSTGSVTTSQRLAFNSGGRWELM